MSTKSTIWVATDEKGRECHLYWELAERIPGKAAPIFIEIQADGKRDNDSFAVRDRSKDSGRARSQWMLGSHLSDMEIYRQLRSGLLVSELPTVRSGTADGTNPAASLRQPCAIGTMHCTRYNEEGKILTAGQAHRSLVCCDRESRLDHHPE